MSQRYILFNWFIAFNIFYMSYVHGYIQSEKEIGLPLFYWQEKFVNFGDYISLKIVERIIENNFQQPLTAYTKVSHCPRKKLLAIGSILTFAREGDVIWGSGANGNWLDLKYYRFKNLDVRAVRGPLTRAFLMENFGICCPEVYGDPALLMPYLFPEFKKQEIPEYPYLIVAHYRDVEAVPKNEKNIVYATDDWKTVIEKILNSKFVISSSLHGIVIAEAFGIPARMVSLNTKESHFKYHDYYQGTQRPDFKIAYSIEEALDMGGEKPPVCDIEKLYNAFPFDYWMTHTNMVNQLSYRE